MSNYYKKYGALTKKTFSDLASRKHAYVILIPVNPTFTQKNWGL